MTTTMTDNNTTKPSSSSVPPQTAAPAAGGAVGQPQQQPVPPPPTTTATTTTTAMPPTLLSLSSIRLHTAHLHECFRIMQLPVELVQYNWNVLTTTPSIMPIITTVTTAVTTTTAAAGPSTATNGSAEEAAAESSSNNDNTILLPLESQIMQVLLLLRLLLIVQQPVIVNDNVDDEKDENDNTREDNDKDINDNETADNDSTSTLALLLLRRNLWTDMLRVRQYLLKTLRGYTNENELYEYEQQQLLTTDAPTITTTTDIDDDDVTVTVTVVTSVLQVAFNLYYTLLQQDEKELQQMLSSASVSAVSAADGHSYRSAWSSILSREESKQCSNLLQQSIMETFEILQARNDWGYLWDNITSKTVTVTPQYYNNRLLLSSSSSSPTSSYSSVEYQTMTWQWSCYLVSMMMSSSSSTTTTSGGTGGTTTNKDYFKVASCAAMAFFVALEEISSLRQNKNNKNTTTDGTDGIEDEPSTNKRSRIETPLELIIHTANNNNDNDKLFTRWKQYSISSYNNFDLLLNKDEDEDENENETANDEKKKKKVESSTINTIITIEEVSKMLQILVEAIWVETSAVHKEKNRNKDNDEGQGTTTLPSWIQEHIVCHVPPPASYSSSSDNNSNNNEVAVVSWSHVWRYLPETTRRLYYNNGPHVHNNIMMPYLDAVNLVQDMDSLQPLLGGIELYQNNKNYNNIDGGNNDDDDKKKMVPITNEQQRQQSTSSSSSSINSSHRRAVVVPVTPPIYMDGMELNEWVVSLLFLELVQPSRQLQNLLNDHPKVLKWKPSLYSRIQNVLERLLQEYIGTYHHHATTTGVKKKKEKKKKSGGSSPPQQQQRLPDVRVSGTTGQVLCVSDESTIPETQFLGKAVVAFYYHALQVILWYSNNIRGEDEDANESSSGGVLEDPVFDRALLSCCILCVTTAIGVTQKLRPCRGPEEENKQEDGNDGNSIIIMPLPIYTVLRICQCSPYDFVRVSNLFVESFTRGAGSVKRGQIKNLLPLVIPKMLVREIQQARVQVMDSLLWARNDNSTEPPVAEEESSSTSLSGFLLPDRIERRRGQSQSITCWWPPEVLVFPETETTNRLIDGPCSSKIVKYPIPGDEDYNEYRCISSLVSDILQMADTRIRDLCSFLAIPPLVAHQVWVAFAYLLRHHVDSLYNRHLDPFILCCMYGVFKMMRLKNELTFARIIDAYVCVRQELGDVTCQRIVRHILLSNHYNSSNNDDNLPPIGNVILLYNRIFVPKMKHHLLKNKSLKLATEALHSNTGLCSATAEKTVAKNVEPQGNVEEMVKSNLPEQTDK